MKYFNLRIIGLFCVAGVVLGFFSSFVSSVVRCEISNGVRRVRGNVYPLEIYRVSGKKLGEAVIDASYGFSFPVSVSENHASGYLWAKKMIEEGKLPKGLTLVYLDAHDDYLHGVQVNNSNWVRFVLGKELCSQAILIFPEWVEKERDIFKELMGKIYRKKSPRPYLSVIDRLNDLPDGETLGPIILSIDCDYFCNSGYPQHEATRQEIEEEIKRIIKILREKNIQIAGLNIAISPGYTSAGQEAFIKNALLEAFSKYRNE